MKLLFVHDGPVFRDRDGKCYEYAFHGLYERYSYLADEITFLMRVKPLTEDTKGSLLPEQVKLIEVPDFKTPKTYFTKKREAEHIIEKAVQNSDILILRNARCSTIALKYAKKYNKPYILENVGCSWDALWNHSFLGKLMAPQGFLRERKQCKNAPFVYYVTNEFLQKRYPTDGESIGCSNVVLANINEDTLKKRLERIQSMGERQEVIVGTAAALDVKYKGQQYVIKTIADLKTKGINIKYKLAGGNRKKSTFLYDLAEKYGVLDNIEFCGSLSASEMETFYDSVDIYIQPSKQEGLPRSVIEAMSHGCPVLGSNVAGIPELIQEENIFKKGNVKDLELHIESLLQSNLQKIAAENFNKSKEYRQEVLEERRKAFYDKFKDKYFR